MLPPPYRLQQVKVPTLSNADCEQQIHDAFPGAGDRKFIQDDMICAGRTGRRTWKVTPGASLLPSLFLSAVLRLDWDEQGPGTLVKLGLPSPQGDSGGPLVCKKKGTWLQAGVVSWGFYSHQPSIGVYTRVQTYVPWILQQMRL